MEPRKRRADGGEDIVEERAPLLAPAGGSDSPPWSGVAEEMV